MNGTSKVAIVTGAARPWGLGRQVALGLAREGFAIAVIDVRDDWGEEAARTIMDETGQKAIYVKTDLSSRTSVEAMVPQVLDKLGRIDVLVNNAAILIHEPVENFSDAAFDQHLNVNLKGTALCCQAVIKPMRQQGGGSIVNISSGGVVQPLRGLALYSASKGAINAFSRVLAVELARDNIMVAIVAPGVMYTGMGRDTAPTQEEFDRLGRHQLVRRPLYPSEVAAVVVSAATGTNHALTGQTLHASGGTYMV